jgi:hypothetical protein
MGMLAVSTLFAIAAPKNKQNTNLLAPILGNYPSTSVALSANTTVTPDAPPSNTVRMNVSTLTSFAGVLEADPATGVVRVTDARPAGTYIVTVKAFDSDGASATKTFTLTVSAQAICLPVSLESPRNSDAGVFPASVAIGDFNGDGRQDLAVAGASSSSVSILLGDGTGNFSTATNFGAGAGPFSVAIGDFNGDGKQDLAIADRASNTVSILLGNGDGSFNFVADYILGTWPFSVAVGDFNEDGNQDLAVGDRGSNDVAILLGDGTGHFSVVGNFGADNPLAIALGDFNNDGHQDVAVASRSSNCVSILFGDGTGNFSAATTFAAGDEPQAVAVGDFNNDGNQDLAVANRDGTASILLGDGAGHFDLSASFPLGDTPYSIAVGDLDGDGNQDLVTANFHSDNVSILLGDGTGHFAPAANFGAGTNPDSVAVGDFDGDGKQDLAVANASSNNVSILLRDCALTPTSVVSRKTHGSAGNFDINLPLTGSPGIECRSTGGTNDYTIIATFGNAVTVNGNPQAQVTLGTGTVGSGGVSNGGMVTISGNTVTIPLTNVANVQTINVTLFGVNGSANVVIPMSVLVGDVNENGTVNAADVAQAKSRIGQPIDQTNFRSDVNTNGDINAGDIAIIKSNLGTGLP